MMYKQSDEIEVINGQIKKIGDRFIFLSRLDKIFHLGGIMVAIISKLPEVGLEHLQWIEHNSFNSGMPEEYILWTVISHPGSGEWIRDGYDATGNYYHYQEEKEKALIRDRCLLKILKISSNNSDPLPVNDTLSAQPLSEFEYSVLTEDLEGYPDIARSILQHFKLDSLKDLPQSQLKAVRNQIKRLKRTHENFVN